MGSDGGLAQEARQARKVMALTNSEALIFFIGAAVGVVLYLLASLVVDPKSEPHQLAHSKDLTPDRSPELEQARREIQQQEKLIHALNSVINDVPRRIEDAARRGALTGSIAGTRARKAKLDPERLARFRMGIVKISAEYNELLKINPVDTIERPKN